MKVLHERCAGLDVHKDLVVASVRIGEGRATKRELRRFGTTTAALLELVSWLEEVGCTHVAMEATGVYWKPVWHVLEGHVELVLANAGRIRNVPGRKSDTNDATWIADLLAHGLISPSFIPPRPIQDLRDLTRTRVQVVREVVQHTQRLQRVLEDGNVKLCSVIANVLGASGRRIVDAIVEGETDPEKLTALGSSRLKATVEELREALRGRITDHHRFLLRQHLSAIDHLQGIVATFDARIEKALEPFRAEAELLTTIPGVSETTARSLVAEIGVDMARFPSAGHLVSWAGLCPRLDESAGKHRSTRIRKGPQWLRPVIVQAAWAAARAKGTYTQAQFYRLKARRGPKKAIIGVAASILTAAYHILQNGVAYHDLGPDHFVRLDRERSALRLVRRIREMGYDVDIRKAA